MKSLIRLALVLGVGVVASTAFAQQSAAPAPNAAPQAAPPAG